jgi:Fe-S-cluster containining protein
VAALDEGARAALAATVQRAAGLRKPRCGALDDAGGCQVYEARPVACRSHGMVYRIRRRPESPGVRMRSCTLNYGGADAVAAHVYDVSAWTERLEAIDRAHAVETGRGADDADGRSLALHDVLAQLLGAPTPPI